MRTLISILITISILISAAAQAAGDETKYLCMSEEAGGLIHKNGSWQSTSFEPDDLAITDCHLLEPTKSFACISNFDMFRYQPSTKRFVMAKTSGFTSEFEESGIDLPSTAFTPYISVGFCEAL